MQTSIENENSTLIFDRMRRSSDEESISRDWQFVNKLEDAGSDDDSIEVIQRETSAPLTSSSDTEFEESENEGHFNDVENEMDDVQEMIDQIQAIIPLKQCPSSAMSLKKETKRAEVTNSSSTWRALYSFILGVVVSLIFHQYKDYIPEKLSSFRFSSELSIADVYSFSFPFAHTNSLAEELNSLKLSNVRGDDEDLLNRLRSYIEKQRMIAESIFTRQMDLLEHVRHVKSDVYVFNITKLARKTTNEEDFISKLQIDKQVTTCDDNITNEQLPLICKDNHAFLIFVEENRIMSMYDAIRQFFGGTERRANNFHETLLSSLTESAHSDDGGDEDSNNFVPDCDHFSKRYRSNALCAKKTSHCEGMNDEPKATILKDQEKFSSCQFSNVGKSNEGKRLKDEVVEDNTKSAPSTVEEDPVDRESAESTEEIEKEPVSGEWLFHLHKARAKLRTYYDNVVQGDWILKLGKAREKLRKHVFRREVEENVDKNDKEKEDHYHWYKKTSEKVKRKLKTYFTKAKVQLKAMNAAIANKFKDLKSELKNRFRNL